MSDRRNRTASNIADSIFVGRHLEARCPDEPLQMFLVAAVRLADGHRVQRLRHERPTNTQVVTVATTSSTRTASDDVGRH